MPSTLTSTSPSILRPLLIFDTHPIQYRSPVFQALAGRHAALKVYFFNNEFNGRRWWFHEVGKIPKQVWGRVLDEGYPCEVLGTDPLSLPQRWRRLREVLISENPSAVMLYGYYLPEHWILRRLCGLLRIPLFFVGETFVPSSNRWRRWLKAPLLHYFFRGVAQFLTIGERNAAYYRQRGIQEARLIAAHYCVDVDFFRLEDGAARNERQRWRESFGISEKSLVVLSVARLFERKRPHDILAMERAMAPDREVIFVIAGNGPMEAELRRFAIDRPRVKFIGFQNQAAIRSCYHGADVLLVSSEFETWGLVANEAFASGIPAVVTDTCGVAGDLVREGETGFVYPVGDIAAGRKCLEKMDDDRTLAPLLGLTARRRVFASYRPEHFADAILAALGRVGGRTKITP